MEADAALIVAFEVPGKPRPLKRHRHTRSGHRYDPSAADKAEFLEAVRLLGALPPVPLDEPLAVDIEFSMPRAKSHFRTGRFAGQLKGTAPRHHCSVPDVDNLAKFVLDSLNTYLYRDDSVIVELHCRKFYSVDREGRTRVRVRRLGAAAGGGL